MIKKLFFSLIILVLTSNTLIKQVSAQGATLECFDEQKTFNDFSKKNEGVNLAKTSVFASIAPLWGVPAEMLFGAPLNKAYPCIASLTQQISESTNNAGISAGESCEVTDVSICEDMGIFSTGSSANSLPKGNLMGMAYSMEQALKDPLPLSLAYYVNQNAQKIPGLKNTALAQDTVEYGGPFLTAIYHYWTISRNVAYAFLAAAMTVIGVMIIMGKSIDPKAGITVQQALPQIIIALILITFSYPIGAAGASLAYNVRGSLDRSSLIRDANNYDPGSAGIGGDQGAWSIVASAALSIWPITSGFSSGGGVLTLVGGVVAVAISVIMGMLVMFKIFGIYLKMLFAILAAPVSFAIGAMPGNSDTTMNWFKQYGAYMVSIPVMSFAAWFVFYLSMDISLKSLVSFDQLGGWWFGKLAGLAVPIITAFGYNIVLTIPDKIDGMFGVKSK